VLLYCVTVLCYCIVLLYCVTVFGKMLIRACVTVLLDINKKFEDTKGVVRSRTSKENRQYNGQKKKDKQ
jgi:hypothetical protein